MKTFLKIIAGLLIAIVLIAIGLNLYFTDERLKSLIMPKVDEAVGRTVQVESVSLTFFSTFPRPGISINKLSIPGESPDDTLFSMNELVAGVELFPLFRKQLNITEIRLDKPRFYYIIYEDGSTNLDFLTTAEDDTTEKAGDRYTINIPVFKITDGTIGYMDLSSNSSLHARRLDADISLNYGDTIHSTVDLNVKNTQLINDGNEIVAGLPVSLTQSSNLDLDGEELMISEGTFSIKGLNLNLTGTVSNWSEDTNLDLAFRSSSDNLDELVTLLPAEYKNEVGDLETRGSLLIDGSVKGKWASEELPDFNAKVEIGNGFLKYPDLNRAIENIHFSGSATNNTISIQQFRAEAGSNRFSMKGSVQYPFNEEKRNVDLDSEMNFDLATIKDFYPINEDSLQMRGDLEASLRLKGNANTPEQAVESGSVILENGYFNYSKLVKPIQDISLESILEKGKMTITGASLVTGENNLKLSGTITNYLGDDPVINLNMDGNMAFNQLKDYYQLEPVITSLTGNGKINMNVRGPIMNPADLAFNGNLTVSNLNIEGDSLVQPVKNLNGKLTLKPAAASLDTLSLVFGSSDLHLRGQLDNYMQFLRNKEDRDYTPHLKGQFHSSFLNSDEIIGWEDTDEQPEPVLIKLLDMTSSVTASVEKLIITGVTMRDLNADVTTTPQQIKMERGSVEMFEGMVTGTFEWNILQPDHTELLFNGSMRGLRAEVFFREYPVFGDKTNFHEHVSGTFNADVTYYSELNQYLEPIIGTTEIDGNFGMSKSRVKNHPLQNRISAMFNAKELETLAFDEWNSTYDVENSVLNFKNLNVTSDKIGLRLSGTQHLVTESIDYKTRITLPGKFKEGIAKVIGKQAANALEQEDGTIMIPLRVTGTQKNPNIQPDQDVIKPILQDFLKNKAGNAVKKLFGDG